MTISSDFIVIDVKDGRQDLQKRIEAGGQVRISVELVLSTVYSDDDGVSQEFGGDVISIKEIV